MSDVAKQEEARAALKEAIRANLLAHDMPETDMPGDFIVVAASVAINKDFSPVAAYYLIFSEETMLPHIARGLLGEGVDLLENGERVQRDDE